MEYNLLTTEQLDDLNSSLNILFDSIKKDTTEFPPIDLLEEIKQCLELLANSPNQLDRQLAKFASLSWPADLRIVVGRLFRTFKIPEEYIQISYELCNFAAQCLGTDWLKSDVQFIRLLASLSSGRLRIILDEPTDVNISQLIACLQLQEFFFKCVNDEHEWINDDDATFVSKSCQEAAVFIIEYVVECAKQTNINLRMDLFLVLYRYLCAFFSIGGADIINNELLNNIRPILSKISDFHPHLTQQCDYFKFEF